MSCKVIGCSYNEDHTTERHCCETCKHNGHGKHECGTKNLINKLKEYKDDCIDNMCKIKGCIDSHTHITKGHSCLYCNTIDNLHLSFCPNNKNTIEPNSLYYYSPNIDSKLDSNLLVLLEDIEDVELNIGEYTTSYGGMGCTWFILKNNKENIGNNEYLFMHSDNWGQYGEDTSHLPRYKAFIYGYNLVE